MSKTQIFCFSLCLEVDKRDDDPEDPGDLLVVAEQRLSTPVVFTAAFLKTFIFCSLLLKELCARWCSLCWSVFCHRNLFLRKRAVDRHTTLSFSNFLVSYCLLECWEAFERCLRKQIRSSEWRRKILSSLGTAGRSHSISSTSTCSDIREWDMAKRLGKSCGKLPYLSSKGLVV